MAGFSPSSMRPSVLLSRKALTSAALSGSPLRQTLAVSVLAARFIRSQAKRTPEHLTTDKVLIGQLLTVAVLAPTTRKEARRARRASKAAGTAS